MKRSQVLDLIIDYMGVVNICYDGDKHKAANDLLDQLEDWGMKPPIKKYCPILLVDTFVWEKE